MPDGRDERGRWLPGVTPNPTGRKGKNPPPPRTLKQALLSKLAEPGRADALAESLLRRVQAGEANAAGLLARVLDSAQEEPEPARQSRQDLRRLSATELALLHALVSHAEGRQLSSSDRARLDAATAAWCAASAIPRVEPELVPAVSDGDAGPAAETTSVEDVRATSGPGDVPGTGMAVSVSVPEEAFTDLTYPDGEASALASEQPTDHEACDGNVTPITWGRERWSH